MLKTHSPILDFLFHNIKPNVNVLDSLNFLIVVSIKYYCSLSQYNFSDLFMLSITLRPVTNFFSHIADLIPS
jgi:hypothetical protein